MYGHTYRFRESPRWSSIPSLAASFEMGAFVSFLCRRLRPLPPPSRPAPSPRPGPEGQQWWTASELRLALGDDRAVYYLNDRQPLTSTVEGHGYENRLAFLAHAVYRKKPQMCNNLWQVLVPRRCFLLLPSPAL